MSESILETIRRQCESVADPASSDLSETESLPSGSLRFNNLEFRATQTVLESIGGAFVLEKISETRKAIRFNISTLSADRNLKEIQNLTQAPALCVR